MINFIRTCKICFHWLIGLTILVAWVMMMTVGYMLLYPYNPITFNDEEFPVKTKNVAANDTLIFEVNSCKHMDLQAEIQVSYVDGLVFDTPKVLGGKSLGCEVINVSQVIPEQLPPGEYQLRVIFNYRVNSFRTITYTKYSEEFEVINN